jgi:hypothetical protein
MGKGSKRRPGNNYEANFEKIFGKKEAVTSFKRYGNRQREGRSGVHILPDITPFKSPVTGEIITTRSQLRQHNKDHGVTDSRDYSGEFFEKKTRERERAINGRTEQDHKDRIDILREQFNR